MKKKIIIAGGTGFIGRYLAARFSELGYEVIVISRQKGHIQWINKNEIIAALNNAEVLINLAGKSVDCRYHEKNKKEIFESRIRTTEILGESIIKCVNPPALWINASTATIYRHSEDKPMTEKEGEIGKGFSVDVAKSWEASFFSFQLNTTRQIALRMAIVLGENGGVMKPFLNLVKFGLGGRQGNGKQMFSWIHVEDVFNIISFLNDNKTLTGAFNCSSPNPVTNEILMETLRTAAKNRLGLPSPTWLLKIGAVVIKTETELILKSRWVIPEKLIAAGFNFKYPFLNQAIKDILKADNKQFTL